MKRLISMYAPSYPLQLIFMLQNTVYEPKDFLKWWWRTKDFRKVQNRRTLKRTKAARSLMLAAYIFTFLQFLLALALSNASVSKPEVNIGLVVAALLVFLVYPFSLMIFLACGIALARLVKRPLDSKKLQRAKEIFHAHPGKKIAVAGSYGKTTTKEILRSVLEQGGKTAATPGNMNVPLSLAAFAHRLDGDEAFVIAEFGEGYKDDIKKMSRMVGPDIGVITGLAPNHLDQYGSLEELKSDMLTLAEAVGSENSFIAGDDQNLSAEQASGQLYSVKGVAGWKVEGVENTLLGLKFAMRKGKKTINVKSQLVGKHLIAPLVMAAAVADSLGLSTEQIETGLQNTKPFEHRLQPRELHGAWLIDDTYNGSLEGFRAGLALLKELKATGKKIYVTPGLVDQGKETKRVHHEIGQLIKDAAPDKVVLMRNSVTSLIQEGLEGFGGEVEIVADPLDYYQNLELTLAGGDIVLLQNDWTDNYA